MQLEAHLVTGPRRRHPLDNESNLRRLGREEPATEGRKADGSRRSRQELRRIEKIPAGIIASVNLILDQCILII